MASQLFASWTSVADLRVAKNNWPLASDNPALTEYFEIAPRNVRRARIRLTIEKSRGHMGPDSEPRNAAGNLTNKPSDDELPPVAPEELLLAQQTSSVLGPRWYAIPNPAAPKRDAKAPPPTQPDAKAPRVDASSYLQGDMEFPYRYTMTPPASYLVAVTTEQLKLAGDEPARG